MEVPPTLLVALMFVTVLTLGIANLLGSLSSAAVTGRRTREGFPLFSWKILLLLVHLSTFWGTREIATVDDWGFVGFLYVLTGPILLLLATTTLLSSETVEGDDNAEALFRRTFLLLGLVQIWVLSTDLMLGNPLDVRAWPNFATLGIALWMFFSKPTGWTAGTIAGWAAVAGALTLRAFGLMA